MSMKAVFRVQTLLFLVVTLFGQSPTPVHAQGQPDLDDLYDIAGEFAFVRIRYDSYYNGGYRGGPWSTDFPAADENFLRGVSRLTNIRVMSEPIILRFDDEEIFDYPFLYALEMGRNGGLSLSPAEIENLREYLLRGGFLLIDDFWGEQQWDTFYRDFSLVFPDREMVELPATHEIFHTFYDIEGPLMIPGRGGRMGMGQQGIDVASNHAIMDDDGRIMVLVNWNSDMGDGWEHTYDQWYPTRFANLAYQLGINYLIYSLTH
ncbi:MAG: DUF4159 domain-containing protein [Pseudohongiellaceae bacterium]